jgi:hypothetical protein
MIDLFGQVPESPLAPFVDIRNQRESVAEEKARLCLELGALCKTPPRSLNSASINRVREWRAAHKGGAEGPWIEAVQSHRAAVGDQQHAGI